MPSSSRDHDRAAIREQNSKRRSRKMESNSSVMGDTISRNSYYKNAACAASGAKLAKSSLHPPSARPSVHRRKQYKFTPLASIPSSDSTSTIRAHSKSAMSNTLKAETMPAMDPHEQPARQESSATIQEPSNDDNCPIDEVPTQPATATAPAPTTATPALQTSVPSTTAMSASTAKKKRTFQFLRRLGHGK
ncbi:hypothetical protein MMC28_008561 [Mycoblastus sanguinarius]|nr:hypothetical protein [Mycoblastus sanguinarius]